MHQLQQVLWSKGTLLSQQHLQLHDRFLETLLSFRLDALVFKPWGFATLQIDHTALAAGEFAIHSASGIFPDGLLFDIPSSDQAPGPLALKFQPDQHELDIYLVIPPYQIGKQNVGDNNDARFSAAATPIRDEITGRSERDLFTARKNFSFLTHAQLRKNLPSLRIARVQQGEGKTLQLDPEFIPPLLNISANEYLLSITRRVLELLTARSSELAPLRRHRTDAVYDFPVADIKNFWLLYTVNSWLPEIRHISERRRGHPELVFRALSALAGALTTFSAKIQPRDLPVYDHNELSACFKTLDAQLSVLLDTSPDRRFLSIPFRPKQPRVYTLDVQKQSELQNSKAYLAIKAEMPKDELIRKTPNAAKLSSAPDLDLRVRHALPGLVLRFAPQAATYLPVKLEYEYFSIDQNGPLWDSVVRSCSIGAHLPAEFVDPKMELLLILPETQEP